MPLNDATNTFIESARKEAPRAGVPLLVVDPDGDMFYRDKARIRRLLEGHGFGCTDEQLTELRLLIGRIMPQNDGRLFAMMLYFCRIDWAQSKQSIVEMLNNLKSEYSAAQSRAERLVVERKMLVATQDIDEHPDGWDLPCLCDTCKSCDGF
jgi:hypothetical protein